MRVQTKQRHHYPWYLQPFFWHQQRKYGQLLQPALLWARVPWLFAAVALLFGVLDRARSPITPALRSLITVRVSQINGCSFCIDINSYSYAQRTGTIDKLNALSDWRDSALFNDIELAVLAYTDAMTYSGNHVNDTLIDQLRAHFDEDALVELTGLIAFQNLSSKFNSALDVPAQGFCKRPSDEKTG